MKIIKNLLATVGVLFLIAILFGLVKLLSLIPFEVVIRFLKGNWGGLLIGVILSHLSMLFLSLFGRKKSRRKGREDDEE